MSTDLLTQLAVYGQYHRETQEPVRPSEAAQRAAAPVLVAPRPHYGLRRLGAALIAAALVIALISIPALLRGPDVEGPANSVLDTTPVEVPSTTALEVPSTTARLSVTPPAGESQPMVQTLDGGAAVALSQGDVWRSEDNGEVWEEWYTQNHEIDLLAVAADGAILAVRNPNDTSEYLGPGSTVNGTPEVHRYDPTNEVWTVIPLTRPDLPQTDLQPASMDPEENECALGGLQSWVDGRAIAVGEQIVILGDHRVVADGICDEDFQLLWISLDGVSWELVPDIDIDGYLTGIIWNGDHYVGYGSPRPSYVGGGGPVPLVWTSTDLESWFERPLDMTVLPEGGFVYAWPRIQDTSSGISLTYDVQRYRPGLDASITDIEALRQWRLDAGLDGSPDEEMSLEETLEMDEVEFPLDAGEIQLLNGFYDVREPFGTLSLSTVDGADWDVTYNPD